MAVAKSTGRLTQAEYLRIERAADIKSEFLDGEMFAMSGGTRWHSLIAVNLAASLAPRLRETGCTAYNADLRVKVEAAGLYAYPDLSIVCGEQRFEDDESDVLLNPCAIIEVLSDSREAYDRGKKFELYRRLPSLREYILVNQHQPHVEQFVRQSSGEWLLKDLLGMQSQLALTSAGITVPLSEIFANVEFPA